MGISRFDSFETEVLDSIDQNITSVQKVNRGREIKTLNREDDLGGTSGLDKLEITQDSGDGGGINSLEVVEPDVELFLDEPNHVSKLKQIVLDGTKGMVNEAGEIIQSVKDLPFFATNPRAAGEQFSTSFLNTATLGLTGALTPDSFEARRLEPRSIEELIGQQAGNAAGFLIGGPMKLGTKIMEKVMPKAAIGLLKEAVRGGIATAISGNEQTLKTISNAVDGFVLDEKGEKRPYSEFNALADIVENKIKSFVAGSVRFGTGTIANILPKYWQRAAGNIITTQVLDKVMGAPTIGEALTGETGHKELTELVFNTMLDVAFAGQKLSKADLFKRADVVAVELEDTGFITRARLAAERAKEYNKPEDRITSSSDKLGFAALRETERRAVRRADLEDLPVNVDVAGFVRDLGELKPKQDIKVKFLDEHVGDNNKPIEMYEMEISGVKADFFVNRSKGETVRKVLTEKIQEYADPMILGQERSALAGELKSKNFGLQKILTEAYNRFTRGQVEQKLKKQFKEAAIVDNDGNPIRLRKLSETLYTKDLGTDPTADFVFLKNGFDDVVPLIGENAIKFVDGKPAENIVAYNVTNAKEVNAFTTYNKHLENIRKHQPAPPNVSNTDITHSQLIEALPRKFGGKRPDDAPIIDAFAEIEDVKLLSELVIVKEQALNKIMPDIKTYNKFIKTLDSILPHVKKGLAGKEKQLDKMRVWVADTALLYNQHFGAAGGRFYQLLIDGYDKQIEFNKIGEYYRDKIIDLYEANDWNDFQRIEVDNQISRALENREQAGAILKHGEDQVELFEHYRDYLDVMEGKISETGRETVPDYFMRVRESTTSLDALIKGVEADDISAVQDALDGKVKSNFLRQRTGELQNYRRDMLYLFDRYAASVPKTLAFEDGVRYYTGRSEKGTPEGLKGGNFNDDIPPELKSSKNFFKMRTVANKHIRDILEPEYMYGWKSKLVMKARRNIYGNLLRLNLRAGLDNSTQDMFNQAFIPSEVWPLYHEVYKQRKRFKDEAPNLQKVLELAGKDKTFMLEISEADLNHFSRTIKKNGKFYAFTTLKELDPFFRAERANWTKSEIAGVVEYLFKKPEWQKTLDDNAGDLVKTVEEMLTGNEQYQREATITGRQLSWQTQLMAGQVATPAIFRTELGKILGMFKRFQFGQIENMVRSFQLSGTNGIAALRILGRGFPAEVKHVEALRSVETLRKAFEEVEIIARKNPDKVDFDVASASRMKNNIQEVEREFNDIIKRIQPINKNNKSAQVALWSRYAAKRWIYVFMFNVISNTALDVIGLNVSDDLADKDPLERAMWGATRNLIPFFWDAKNPGSLFASPIIPDTGGDFSSPRQYLKGFIKWGFNVVPFAGLFERMTNRFASDWLTDQIIPKDSPELKL